MLKYIRFVWLMALCILLVGCGQGDGAGPAKSPDASGGLTAGEQAIVDALSATPLAEILVLDEDGNRVPLQSQDGEILVINFWAAWCPYCIEEIPLLNEVAQKGTENGFRVVMVNTLDNKSRVGYSQEDILAAQNAKAALGIETATFVDDGLEASEAFRLRTLPRTVIVDGENIIRFQYPGMLTSAAQLEELIENVRKYAKYK